MGGNMVLYCSASGAANGAAPATTYDLFECLGQASEGNMVPRGQG